MQKTIQLVLSPEQAANTEQHQNILANELKIEADRISVFSPTKKSIDGRSRNVKVLMEFEVVWDEDSPKKTGFNPDYQHVENKPEIIIIGGGPAGLFAALRLIERGLKPNILERGKEVRGRRRDISDINRKLIVNPESNYCFGEGGAGTFSDGKLYTRSKKRGM